MLKRLASYFLPRAPKVAPVSKPYPVHLPACGSPIRGNALFSYIADSVGWPDGHLELLAHSNFWESREIARILTDLGFAVDAVNWNDEAFQPAKEYDLVLDIDANLQRWAPLLPEKTVRILHLTGSYGPFQNKAELERVAAFERVEGETLFAHLPVHIKPGSKHSLAPHAGKVVEHLIENAHAGVRHADLIRVREAERHAEIDFTFIFLNFAVLTAGVPGELLYERENSFKFLVHTSKLLHRVCVKCTYIL